MTALEALRAIEWVYTYGFADKNCPACKNIEAEGHKDDCTTTAALTTAPATTTVPVCKFTCFACKEMAEQWPLSEPATATEPVCDGGKELWFHQPRKRCTICQMFQPAESGGE